MTEIKEHMEAIGTEGNKVRLSAMGAVAVTMEQEKT
jgi:hypothetical protein